jgi:hypothetical protein
MNNADLESIRRAIVEVCEAYEEPDSPEALSCAFYQLRRVRDYVLPRCAPTGRKGGLSKSPALQAARRANGAKSNGRPRKPVDAASAAPCTVRPSAGHEMPTPNKANNP